MKYKTLFVYIMMKNTETKKMLEKIVMEESLLISPSEIDPVKLTSLTLGFRQSTFTLLEHTASFD